MQSDRIAVEARWRAAPPTPDPDGMDALISPITEDAEATQADLRRELIRSRLLTWEDLEALPPPQPLIDGYLFKNSLAAIYGKPGAAKTGAAMSMALSVATGTPWYGLTVKQGRVLYLAAEGGQGLGQRQLAWREASGNSGAGMDNIMWGLLTLNLLDESWSSGLVKMVEEIQPALVVIDTLARTMATGDENRSGDMACVVDAADRVRRASGATVLGVHHTPKESITLRGHSVLEGALDTAILMEADDAGTRITMTVTKQKDSRRSEPKIFQLQPLGDSFVLMESDCHGSPNEIVGAEKTLRDVIWQSAGSEGLSTGALLRISEMSERSFHRAKKSLVNRGVIRNIGTERTPRWVGVDDD